MTCVRDCLLMSIHVHDTSLCYTVYFIYYSIYMYMYSGSDKDFKKASLIDQEDVKTGRVSS